MTSSVNPLSPLSSACSFITTDWGQWYHEWLSTGALKPARFEFDTGSLTR